MTPKVRWWFIYFLPEKTTGYGQGEVPHFLVGLWKWFGVTCSSCGCNWNVRGENSLLGQSSLSPGVSFPAHPSSQHMLVINNSLGNTVSSLSSVSGSLSASSLSIWATAPAKQVISELVQNKKWNLPDLFLASSWKKNRSCLLASLWTFASSFLEFRRGVLQQVALIFV